jgi:Flp pilus assembly protein TadD
MKRFSVIVALLLAWSGARAEGPDDQYVRIYNLIQEADKLNSGGQPSEALPKYLEAQTGLQRFQKGYPDWNVKVINFRLNYVATKIAAASARVPPPATPAPGSTGTQPAAPPSAGPAQPAKAVPSDWEPQLAALTDQVRQLQADKAVLEAKLKEALSVQPAALDPRELARAEEKIKGLQKENDLLKVTLDQEKAKPLPAPDTKALDEARQTLAEANLKLAEQTKTANALALERTALQTKLNSLTPSPANAAELETTRKALQEAHLKLTEQTKLASGLAIEKEALQARLQTLNTEAEAATALRAENQLLKKQLADLNAAPPPTAKAEEANRQLAQAQAQLATLQSDKEMLRLEKTALENRVKQLSAPPVTPAAPTAPAKAADASRIKQLERERDDLQKQLTAANKELYSRKSKAVAAKVADLESQLATLRARLEVYEARQVPYTAEEMARFKQPQTKLVQADRKGGKKSVRELPPGTVALVAEAQRYYANKQLDKAEEKYLQVLQQDKQNVPTLANLAAIELDLDHFETAEINIKQAVALAPDDPYSLFVLGRLKFRQKKFDEAIDAFSRAAKLDPQDAQVQNFLGLALSEKGLRGPAETALRKAIQLDPGYANAHNNLAVIYLTQQPPLTELARWHYQKALAAGHPRNAELEKMLDATRPAGTSQ